MFDLACNAPDYWEGDKRRQPNSALRLDGDFLSEDFCILGGEHFFVRCVLEIPVHGLADKFGYGVWSTLSRANFEIYSAGFDAGATTNSGPWWGWFSNRLAGWSDTLNIGCWVHPQPDRQRPVISLDASDHELAIAQSEGVDAERILQIYAAAGHAVAASQIRRRR